MALTISTGFVVDDAIVVLENITRHIEAGATRMQAAILGAREVGFTVLSISLSLIAVFLPLLLMGSIVGRLFREFAITLSIAVMISLIVSLTTTPMMCSLILPRRVILTHGALYRITERGFDAMLGFYRTTLAMALRHPLIVMLVLLAMIGLNVHLFRQATYDLFPVQDTGLLIGSIQGDQSISFQSMKRKLAQLQTIVQDDPAVATVVGVTGGRQTNSGFVYISLKPFDQRQISADGVVGRLRGKLAAVAGARLYLVAVSDLRTGGRQSNATYQYTLLSDDTATLYKWAPRLTAALLQSDILKDVNSDQQQGGLETDLTIDRPTAMRLGLTLSAIDNTLYDAFGQRQVSTIYNALNQYHVVMEVAPRYWQDPSTLRNIWVSTAGANPTGVQQTNAVAGLFVASTAATSSAASIAADSARNLAMNSLAASGHSSASAGSAVSTSQETMIPLSAFTHYQLGQTPLSVNHQGQFAATTISFNLAPGRALSEAQKAIEDATTSIRLPSTIHGAFAGTAATYQQFASGLVLLFARGARRRLHRAGHPLRKLYPSPDDPFDAAVGERRRADRDENVQHRIHHHRGDRHHPAHRHREKERDHDDRFRAPGRAPGPCDQGRDHPGVPASLPADHDDDFRRAVRRPAARLRHRRGLGAAPSPGNHHRRRLAGQPGLDPLYDADHLPLS